jgi:ankyrin repeat protein
MNEDPTPPSLSDALHSGTLVEFQDAVRRADVTSRDVAYVLGEAARFGLVDRARFLLDAGCPPDGVAPHHPLTHAVACVEILEALLDAGATRFTAGVGRTLLHLTAQVGTADVIDALVRRRADVDATDERGWTPLHCAAWTGDTDVVDALLKHGARPNGQSTSGGSGAETVGGETPLFVACVRGKQAIVKALLKQGADPNLANVAGENCAFALARCRATGDVRPMAKSLLKRGLVLVPNSRGASAVTEAAAARRVEIAALLAAAAPEER